MFSLLDGYLTFHGPRFARFCCLSSAVLSREIAHCLSGTDDRLGTLCCPATSQVYALVHSSYRAIAVAQSPAVCRPSSLGYRVLQ